MGMDRVLCVYLLAKRKVISCLKHLKVVTIRWDSLYFVGGYAYICESCPVAHYNYVLIDQETQLGCSLDCSLPNEMQKEVSVLNR